MGSEMCIRDRNGTKLWISGADRADYGLVFARTGGEGRSGVTAFIVETSWPGFNVSRVVHTLRSAKYATEIQIDNLRVPHENILGEEGGGFAIANDRLARQRVPYAAECLGAAIKAHEMAVEYSKIRKTFGASLSSRQGIQWMLVENEIDIRAARLLVLDAAAKELLASRNLHCLPHPLSFPLPIASKTSPDGERRCSWSLVPAQY